MISREISLSLASLESEATASAVLMEDSSGFVHSGTKSSLSSLWELIGSDELGRGETRGLCGLLSGH